MHQEQRQRAHKLLTDKGVARALFAHPNSITWLTGFAPPIQLGPHLFAGGPPLVWYDDGHFTLFVVDAYAVSAKEFAQQSDGEIVTHTGYAYEQPLAGTESLLASMDGVLSATSKAGTLGIERRHVPDVISAFVQEFIEKAPAAIDGWLEPLRRVKTEEELAKLRANFALADVGQATARQMVETGLREIDVWAEAHSAIQRAAGRRVPLGNDCVVGHRDLNFTGWPLDYEIGPSDSLIVDLGTGLDGYWSDGCGTYYPAQPTVQQTTMHQKVTEALDLAISLVRPGVMVSEIDRQVRDFITSAGYPAYPHHTGHGIGVSSHEAPRIVPYSDETLEVGMVIMLEPGIYLPGETGVRLEDAVLVTPDGAEVLTQHDKSLP